jgi:hypothetical protein
VTVLKFSLVRYRGVMGMGFSSGKRIAAFAGVFTCNATPAKPKIAYFPMNGFPLI